MDYALSDHYDPDPDAFHFAESVREAYQAYALRLDPERDGDLSRALAHIMAWDRVMRGILHWDQLGRSVPFDDAFSLPVYPRARVPGGSGGNANSPASSAGGQNAARDEASGKPPAAPTPRPF